MKTAITFAAGCVLASGALAETPVLTVYAADYIASEWGPGPKIEEMFEETCGCDLQFSPGDLMPRLLLEGGRTEADVVMGLNSDVTKKARESGLFAPHGVDLSPLTLPVAWEDDIFLPYDYSATAFIYDTTRLSNPPESFEALLEADDDISIVIQDPRSSISGLATVLWVEKVFGDRAQEAWAKLAPKILTATKTWSESYGLFTDGEADMVMSYVASPAYHIIAEGDRTKKAAIFPEGHYFMVQLAAKIADTDQPELADDFMQFVLSEPFQTMIATGDWSFPAALPQDKWPEGFKELQIPDTVLFYSEDEAADLRDKAIEAWRAALSQ